MALEAVLKALETYKVDKVIVAGDHFHDAPQPMEVFYALRGVKGWIIKGNKEERVLNYHKGKFSDWDKYLQMSSFMWTYKQLSTQALTYIASLPDQIVIDIPPMDSIRVVHGSPFRIDELLYPDKNENEIIRSLHSIEEKVLVCGHTHIQWHRRIGDKLIINPGSVGVSYNKQGFAEYSIMEWSIDHWEVSQHLAEYDKSALALEFHRSGYLEEGGAYAKAILYSIMAGKDEFVNFVQFAYRLAEERGRKGMLVPNDIWMEAEQVWEWK